MLFLIPHLFPPARLLEAASPGLHLPALASLLARGTRIDQAAEGVEAALCESLGIARQQDWPLAPITLEADGQPAGDRYWLRADPVHLRVMRDRIVLTDSRALNVPAEEADALADAIGQHFGDSLRPLPAHPQRWYVSFPQPPRLRTTLLSEATGRDIDSLLPQGEDARHFRSLLNELQMLLFEHPVNQAREARGELPVNSLWLWGGGGKPAVPTPRLPLFAHDPEARALAAFCQAQCAPLPARLERDLLKTEGVVLLDQLSPAGLCGDAYGWREAIRAMETDWFAPLLNALGAIHPSGLRVFDPTSGKALHLKRGDAWKIWRRPRSLSSMLA
ncbi:MAG: hypothetical protein R6W97_11120 [Thiobacillus sp.]